MRVEIACGHPPAWYDCVAMAEAESIEKMACPICGSAISADQKKCGNAGCGIYLKNELECLRSMDVSLGSIRRIIIWFVIVAILAMVAGIVVFVYRGPVAGKLLPDPALWA